MGVTPSTICAESRPSRTDTVLRLMGLSRVPHRTNDYNSLPPRLNDVKGRMLRPSTPVKTRFERIVKSVLLYDNNFTALYEPFELPLMMGARKGGFKPDFVVPEVTIKGRMLAIEPHGNKYVTHAYLEKLKKAGDEYGLHIVLITYSSQSLKNVTRGDILDHVATHFEIRRNKKTRNGRAELNQKLRKLLQNYGEMQRLTPQQIQ